MGSSSLLNLLFFSPCFLLEAGSPPPVLPLPRSSPLPRPPLLPSRPQSRWLDGPIGPRQGRQACRVMTRDYDNRPRMPSSLSASALALSSPPSFFFSFSSFAIPPSGSPVQLRALGPLLLLSRTLRSSLPRYLVRAVLSLPSRSAGRKAPRAFRASRPLLLVRREKESHASLLDNAPPPSPPRTRTLYSTLFIYTTECCHALARQRIPAYRGTYFCLARRASSGQLWGLAIPSASAARKQDVSLLLRNTTR